MTIKQETQILAIDEEKGIEILYTTFPDVPFISFVEYDDREITFSKQLTDLKFLYDLDLSNDLPAEKIVEGMLDLAEKFKDTYYKGVKQDEPSYATMFCDKRDRAKQFYHMMHNDHFSDKAMYEFAKDTYASIECDYGYDLLFKGMKYYYSQDISIKDEISKALEGHLKGSILVVYRGINEKNRVDGLSYTLDLEIAKFFANRWGEEGYINKYEVNIDDVLAFIDNGEKEIITNNAILLEENIELC